MNFRLPTFEPIAIRQAGLAPLRFHGRLLLDATDDLMSLRLYETDDDRFVLSLVFGAELSGLTRRVFAASNADDLIEAVAALDSVALIDGILDDGIEPSEALTMLLARIDGMMSAVERLAATLNFDASAALARLSALSHGDQTWLQ